MPVDQDVIRNKKAPLEETPGRPNGLGNLPAHILRGFAPQYDPMLLIKYPKMRYLDFTSASSGAGNSGSLPEAGRSSAK